LDGVLYTTGDFSPTCQKQSADIFVNSKPRGFIEIGYGQQKRPWNGRQTAGKSGYILEPHQHK
jgi:hypothetical protein